MGIDSSKHPFLFSVGTFYSYQIAKRYYHNTQYVWCSYHFDDKGQPPTSNPFTIARRYIEQITTADRLATEIDTNKAGILRGADYKYKAGVISKAQLEEIKQLVAYANYEAFFPVLFVISSKMVEGKCREVERGKKASDSSVEYIIDELQEGEYELINLRKLFDGFVEIPDKKAGE